MQGIKACGEGTVEDYLSLQVSALGFQPGPTRLPGRSRHWDWGGVRWAGSFPGTGPPPLGNAPATPGQRPGNACAWCLPEVEPSEAGHTGQHVGCGPALRELSCRWRWSGSPRSSPVSLGGQPFKPEQIVGVVFYQTPGGGALPRRMGSGGTIYRSLTLTPGAQRLSCITSRGISASPPGSCGYRHFTD